MSVHDGPEYAAEAMAQIGDLASVALKAPDNSDLNDTIAHTMAQLLPQYAESFAQARPDPKAWNAVLTQLQTHAAGYKAPEGFTLGEGQERFGPQGGAPIASVPKSVPPEADFTLSPGQERRKGTGELIASAPKTPDDASWHQQVAMVNGKRVFVWMNPKTKEVVDLQGNPVIPEPEPPNLASQPKPRIDVRNIPEAGPNGEPGTRVVSFADGVPVSSFWTKGNVSATERKDLGDFQTLATAFQAVKDAYQPDLVGPMAGRIGSAMQEIPGVATPKGFTNLKSKLAQVQNSLLYLRTGKQINEQEFQRMMRELPSENNKSADFETKLANSIALMESLAANRRAITGVQSVPQSRPGQPRVGEERTGPNGETGVWDGSKWVLKG